jgi:hypothetical protein
MFAKVSLNNLHLTSKDGRRVEDADSQSDT